MATITTRSGKGSPLTNSEVDSNFSNINTELGQKESASNKGVANGYASLDGSGKVPSAQLPSYVDDVVEGANLAALPATGETGKIYVTLDTNKTYRWSGSAYVEISASPGSTDAVTEGSTNLYFTNARARSAISASGSLSYNSSTGVLSYTAPTAVSQLSNDSGYITSSALSPYLTSATAASTYQTALVSGTSIKTVNGNSVLGSGNIQIDGGVTSFNTRTGAVTLSSGDVTTALGFTPYNATNPSGYITSSSNITGTAAGITGYTLADVTGTSTSVMTRNSGGDSAVGSRFHFTTCTADGGNFALVGLNWGGAAGTYKDFEVYDYPNSRPLFRAFGSTRNFEVYGALSVNSASTVSVSSWAKWTLETTGVTAKARQGSDGNGLNFTSNALWNGSSWVEDDTAKKKFAYIQHLGNGRHEFRTSPTGAGVSWTTSLTIDESAVNSSVALQQSGNQVLHAGNYGSGYFKTINGSSIIGTGDLTVSGTDNTKLPLTGGTLTGAIYVGTTGSGSATRALRVGPSGGSPASFGSYAGSWRSTIEIWDNAATRMLHLTPPDGTNYNWSSIKSTDAGLRIDVGGSGGTNAIDIGTNGVANFPQGLQQGGNQVLHAGNYSSYALPLSGGTVSGNLSVTGTINGVINTTAPGGSVLIKHSVSETDAWIFQENAANWGLYWKNAPSGNHTFGGYTSVGAELVGMSAANASGNGVTTSNFVGATSAIAQWMISNYTGYIWSASTVYAAGSMVVGGNTVLHAGNYTSYSPSLTGSGASGTWGISITGSAGSATTATRSTIEDTRAAQRTPNAYDDYRASYEFTNQIVGSDWHTAFTMQGWHDGYAAWQIIGPASTSAHENFYLRSGINTTWNSARTILHSGNYTSYSAFSGLVTSSGNNGFANATYFGAVRNPIWSFGNASSYGISYYQGSAGRDGIDTITLHPNGSTTATGATFATNSNNAFVNNNVVLNAANYTSYALPLSGGTLTGDLRINSDWGAGSFNEQLIIYGTYPSMTFRSTTSDTGWLVHTQSDGGLTYYSIAGASTSNWTQRMTLLTNGELRKGGSSGDLYIHSGNYTSYSPSLTGSGASGTWSINITGSAGSASNSTTVGGLAPAQFFNNMGNNHGTYTDFNSVPGFGAYYVQAGTNSPTGVGAHQWYGFTLGLGNEYAQSSYASQLYWARRAQNSDTYIYVRDREGGTWNGWTKIKAGYADNSGQLNGYSSAENGASVVLRTASNGYLYLNNWINVASSGLFSGTNAAHWHPTGATYGVWNMSGSKNGYSGISCSGTSHNLNWMVDMGGNLQGWYNQSYGWQMYWSGGSLTVFKNSYGGGTAATVLDSANYTSYAPSLTGSGASGSWNITAANATRASGNFYIDTNYGRGIIGLYSAYRYQGVFAMGDAYKLADDGTTTGNLYGMAWSHPYAGGAAGNLTDHGMLIINNGAFKCAISNSIVASGNITAYSDERLKTNWRDMPDNFVERLAQVRVGCYERIDDGTQQVGVSAQSLQPLLPEAIQTAKDEIGTLSVSYGNAAMASAVELAKELVMLKRELAEIKSRLH